MHDLLSKESNLLWDKENKEGLGLGEIHKREKKHLEKNHLKGQSSPKNIPESGQNQNLTSYGIKVEISNREGDIKSFPVQKRRHKIKVKGNIIPGSKKDMVFRSRFLQRKNEGKSLIAFL